MELLISVIIVSRNSVRTIRSAIESVISQTYKKWELIVIDGCSQDGTIEIVKEYSDALAYWISEPDSGVYDAMEKGVKRAKGDFIYFLGSDDTLFNGNVLLDLMDNIQEKSGIYYGNVFSRSKNVIYDGPFNSLKLSCRNICQQAIFYPKWVFEKFRYDTRFTIASDYELNLRLWRKGVANWKYLDMIVCSFNDINNLSSPIDHEFDKVRIGKVFENMGVLYGMLLAIRLKLLRPVRRLFARI